MSAGERSDGLTKSAKPDYSPAEVSMALKLLVAVVCFLLTASVFFLATNDAQRDVYMDEVFHVPQVQRYCAGNFTAVIDFSPL